MPRSSTPDPALLRRWVDTWRLAGPELEAIRLRELRSLDTVEAIRQMFTGIDPAIFRATSPTSGLVEQQAWFAKLRAGRRAP